MRRGLSSLPLRAAARRWTAAGDAATSGGTFAYSCCNSAGADAAAGRGGSGAAGRGRAGAGGWRHSLATAVGAGTPPARLDGAMDCSSAPSTSGRGAAPPARWPARLASSSRGYGTVAAAGPSPTPREELAGQPTPATHPELLAPGELWPGLAAAEFAERRRRLAAALPPRSLVVLPSAAQTFMAGVIPYPYRQDADYLYLTALAQQGVALLLTGEGGEGGGDHSFALFLPPPNAEREAWDGATVGAVAARAVFGADEAHPLSEVRLWCRGGGGGGSARRCLPARRGALSDFPHAAPARSSSLILRPHCLSRPLSSLSLKTSK